MKSKREVAEILNLYGFYYLADMDAKVDQEKKVAKKAEAKTVYDKAVKANKESDAAKQAREDEELRAELREILGEDF